MIKIILLLVLSMLCFWNYALSQSSWVVSKHNDGIKVYLKDTEGNPFKSFKVETTFDADIETVLVALLDVKNIPSYYEMIFDVQDIKEISPKEATYTLYFDFPWPIKDRFSRVESRAYVKKDGSVVVLTNGVSGDIKPKLIQVDKMKSIWVLKKGKDKTTQVMHSGYMDPGGKIPPWLTKKETIKNPFRSIQRMRDRFKYYEGIQMPFWVKG